VDLWVKETVRRQHGETSELTPEDKAALIRLLNVDVGTASGVMSVLSAIEYSVESLCRMLEDNEASLNLPLLFGLSAHAREY
jgi:hypothetical protein